jgi:predicted Zn-dependent protease
MLRRVICGGVRRAVIEEKDERASDRIVSAKCKPAFAFARKGICTLSPVEKLHHLEPFHAKGERALFKIVLWLGGSVLAFIVLATVAYHQVRNWQVRRLSAEANALVDRGDFKQAGLEARRILQIHPESPVGVRILARIADRSGSQASVELWQRVATSNAGGPEDYYALGAAAIRFGDLKTARSAFEKLPAAQKNTARYHALEADFALAQGDGGKVDRALSAAIHLDPGNKEYVFRQATLRLGASDAAMRAKAQETLKQLQDDKQFRRQATQQLANFALRSGNTAEALVFARQLDGFPERDFRDRLLLLTMLAEAKDPALQATLESLESVAANEPSSVTSLMMWLNAHAMSTEAIDWSKKLSPSMVSQRAVSIALSDALISAKDWGSLERLTKAGNWGDFDFLRLALRARAFRETNDMPSFNAQWTEAKTKVSGSADAALMLSETASKWGWNGEAIDLLWLVAKDSAKGEQALQALYQHFVKSGDTQNLYRVLLHLNQLRPGDRDVENNLAQISLLLQMNTDRGQELARDVHEKDPKNPIYASTYAFALQARGETQKALKVFKDFSDAQLREPTIALYYGITLAAAGDNDRAAQFLELGEQASLLPEEKALLERARRAPAQR